MSLETELEQIVPPLAREQKIGALLLAVFAILAIGLGVLQIRNTFYAPFALSNQVPASFKTEVNSPDTLRFRDTDQDGLNDFDELYVYGTSPYIADTDSDGILDKAEIDRGSDPLCPAGQTCAGPAALGTASPRLNTTSSLQTLFEQGPEAPPPPPDLTAILSNPAQLRVLLKEAGVEDKVLRAVSDQELLRLVGELMNTSTFTSNIKSLNATTNPSARQR